MATITKYKLNGIEYSPPREWQGVEVLATFDGDSVQANITTSEFSFINNAKSAIDSWMSVFPTEGMPIDISVSSETTTYNAFKGYLDFRTLQYLSDVELKCGVKEDNGIASLDTRLRGITMLLLEQKGALTSYDYCHIPYIIENRKTILEKLYLLAQTYQIIKTGVDEIHKILNIASDIPTLGLPVALINLAVSVVNIVLLIFQLVTLLGQIRDSFFPPIRYHKGISLYQAIYKAVSYCGYGLETGFGLTEILQFTKLCPSKNDEIGALNPTSTASGILKPSDFGYVTHQLFELANMMYNTKVAIVGNNVVLRSMNDPYWNQTSGYIMPNVKVEQAFINNGSKSINYDELSSSRIIQYSTDDSDLWTLTNVNDQISVTTVTPITVTNQKRVLLTGSEQINIPYSLCVRKDVVDDLYDTFIGVTGAMNSVKDMITNKFDEYASTLGQSSPAFATVISTITNRTGCMKIENHYFSTPKIVYLDSTNRIPSNYIDIIGAVALNNNYHSYKSFVPGIRNPLDLSDTNCKDIYKDVTIPFGIDAFNLIISNSFFNTINGNIGKFTSVKWLPDKDKAVVDYWVQSSWAVNIEENTI